MFKLPDIFAIRQQTENAFEKEVQDKYESLMQRFAAEVTKAANIGYCGWSEKFTNCWSCGSWIRMEPEASS